MINKIEILGIKVDNDSAQDAVIKVAEFLETEILSTVGILTASALVESESEPKWLDMIANLDLKVIGDKEILKAAGVEDKSRMEEIEENLFLKGVIQYAVDREKGIVLLTEKNSEQEALAKYLKKYVKGMNIVRSLSLDEPTEDEENIVNLINAESPDLIIAAISGSRQEEFLYRIKTKLNASVWIGLGQSVPSLQMGELKTGFLGKLIEKTLLKRKISKYQSEKGD